MKLSNDEIKQHLEKFGDQFTAEFEKEMKLRGDYQKYVESKDKSAGQVSEDNNKGSLLEDSEKPENLADSKELSERAEQYPNYAQKTNPAFDEQTPQLTQSNTHKQNG